MHALVSGNCKRSLTHIPHHPNLQTLTFNPSLRLLLPAPSIPAGTKSPLLHSLHYLMPTPIFMLPSFPMSPSLPASAMPHQHTHPPFLVRQPSPPSLQDRHRRCPLRCCCTTCRGCCCCCTRSSPCSARCALCCRGGRTDLGGGVSGGRLSRQPLATKDCWVLCLCRLCVRKRAQLCHLFGSRVEDGFVPIQVRTGAAAACPALVEIRVAHVELHAAGSAHACMLQLCMPSTQ